MKLLRTTLSDWSQQEIEQPKDLLGLYLETPDGTVYQLDLEDDKLAVTLTQSTTSRLALKVEPRVSNKVYISPA